MTAVRLPDPASLPAEVRAQLSAASRTFVKARHSVFWFEAERHWGVTPLAIRAYLLARYAGLDPYAAIATAKYGQVALGPLGQSIVRASVWRLQQIEAAV